MLKMLITPGEILRFPRCGEGGGMGKHLVTDLFKVSKIFFDLFKVSKVGKTTISVVTCSKSSK